MMAPPTTPPGGSPHVYAMQHSALIKAAGVAPDVEDAIRRGVRPLGSETQAVTSGIEGFSTAATLNSITDGWHRGLSAMAGQVGDFGPRLKQSARTVKAAEGAARQRILDRAAVRR